MIVRNSEPPTELSIIGKSIVFICWGSILFGVLSVIILSFIFLSFFSKKGEISFSRFLDFEGSNPDRRMKFLNSISNVHKKIKKKIQCYSPYFLRFVFYK